MSSVLFIRSPKWLPLLLLSAAFSSQSFAVEGVAQPEMRMRLDEFRNDPKQVLGLEIWEIAGNKHEINSAFGHVLFRFIDGDSDDMNDLMLNYYPVMESANGNPFLALIRHYELGVEINTLKHFMETYLAEYRRPMKRIVVLSTPQMRKDLVESTFENFYSQEARGKYSGFGNNCLGAILRSFEEAGFPNAGSMVFLPTDTKNYLKRVGLAPFPPIELDALEEGESSENLFAHSETRASAAIRYERLPFEAYEICVSQSCVSVAYQVFEKLLNSDQKKIKKAIRFRPWTGVRRIGPPHRSSGISSRSARSRIEWRGLKNQVEEYYKLLKREYELKQLP